MGHGQYHMAVAHANKWRNSDAQKKTQIPLHENLETKCECGRHCQ